MHVLSLNFMCKRLERGGQTLRQMCVRVFQSLVSSYEVYSEGSKTLMRVS